MVEERTADYELYVFGSTTRDHLFRIDAYSELNQYGRVSRKNERLGGKAPNCAVAAARRGLRVGASLLIGTDFVDLGYAAYVAANGVSICDALQFKTGEPTPLFYSVFDGCQEISFGVREGHRPVDWGAVKDFAVAALGKCKSQIIYPVFSNSLLNAEIIRVARARGRCKIALTVLDDLARLEPDALETYLLSAHMVFMNQAEGRFLASRLGRKWLLRRSGDADFIGIMTLGPHGAIVYSQGAEHHVSSPRVADVFSVVGAGDFFAGSFIAEIVQQRSGAVLAADRAAFATAEWLAKV